MPPRSVSHASAGSRVWPRTCTARGWLRAPLASSPWAVLSLDCRHAGARRGLRPGPSWWRGGAHRPLRQKGARIRRHRPPRCLTSPRPRYGSLWRATSTKTPRCSPAARRGRPRRPCSGPMWLRPGSKRAGPCTRQGGQTWCAPWTPSSPATTRRRTRHRVGLGPVETTSESHSARSCTSAHRTASSGTGRRHRDRPGDPLAPLKRRLRPLGLWGRSWGRSPCRAARWRPRPA